MRTARVADEPGSVGSVAVAVIKSTTVVVERSAPAVAPEARPGG
ncbi:hypothetical protein [Krasilnikovia cinnamomea]|nr:hypothetical protein [Krasilnikovia cinnamomea]